MGELLETLSAANTYQEAEAALTNLAEAGLDLRRLKDALARGAGVGAG